jgi:hypothetical protein
MKTQIQYFWSSHNKLADKTQFMDWLLRQENKPTLEELQKLRAKNPSLWSGYTEITPVCI